MKPFGYATIFLNLFSGIKKALVRPLTGQALLKNVSAANAALVEVTQVNDH